MERARARAVAAHGDPAPARARAAARRRASSGCGVRVSYVKVAEFQRRGALHFHCVLRLDGVSEDGELEAPRREFTARAADRRGDSRPCGTCRCSPPRPTSRGRLPGSRRAGARDPLGRAGRGARARHRAAPRRRRARATSPSTRPSAPRRSAGCMYRLEAGDLERLKVRPHVRRLVECAWRLGGDRAPARAAAAALGAPARLPRALLHQEPPLLDDVHGAAPGAPRARSCGAHGERRDRGRRESRRVATTAGSGYRTLGDAWLAESGASARSRQRRVAREELRTGHRVGGESRHEGRR